MSKGNERIRFNSAELVALDMALSCMEGSLTRWEESARDKIREAIKREDDALAINAVMGVDAR